MPLTKSRPSPRPAASSTFSDAADKSLRRDRKKKQKDRSAENKIAPVHHERQRSRALQPQSAMGVTTTITAAMNDDNDGEDSAEDDTEESGAIGASAAGTGRFARPDYLLQGLLARARKRVKERGGRINVAEGDGERVSEREVFLTLPVNNR